MKKKRDVRREGQSAFLFLILFSFSGTLYSSSTSCELPFNPPKPALLYPTAFPTLPYSPLLTAPYTTTPYPPLHITSLPFHVMPFHAMLQHITSLFLITCPAHTTINTRTLTNSIFFHLPCFPMFCFALPCLIFRLLTAFCCSLSCPICSLALLLCLIFSFTLHHTPTSHYTTHYTLKHTLYHITMLFFPLLIARQYRNPH